MDEIIVVARTGSANLEYLLIPNISITQMFMAAQPDKTIAEALSPTEKRDFRIAATAHTPEIIVKGATQSQLAAIVNAVTNADRVPELSQTMQELATKGVTLTWTITDQAPANFAFNQLGGIHFQITAASAEIGVKDEVAGSNVEIIVVASRLNENNLETSFNFVISHELGHLTRNSQGDFRTDGGGTGDTVYDIDNALYGILFRGYNEKNFLESRDVPMINHTTDIFGSNWQAFGNDGNNYVDSFEGTHDEIHVGAGDDLIFSRTGSDSIYLKGQGVKIIVDYGSQGQILDIDGVTIEGVSVNSLIGTRIGNDAYITYGNTGLSPVNDDNATIIIGYYGNPGGSTIEFIFADGGYVMAYQLLGYPDGVEPYGWNSVSAEFNYNFEFDGRAAAATFNDGVPILADGISFALEKNASVIKSGTATDVLSSAWEEANGYRVAYADGGFSNYGIPHNITMAESMNTTVGYMTFADSNFA